MYESSWRFSEENNPNHLSYEKIQENKYDSYFFMQHRKHNNFQRAYLLIF